MDENKVCFKLDKLLKVKSVDYCKDTLTNYICNWSASSHFVLRIKFYLCIVRIHNNWRHSSSSTPKAVSNVEIAVESIMLNKIMELTIYYCYLISLAKLKNVKLLSVWCDQTTCGITCDLVITRAGWWSHVWSGDHICDLVITYVTLVHFNIIIKIIIK